MQEILHKRNMLLMKSNIYIMHDNVLLQWLVSITNSVRPATYLYYYWTRPLLEE
jgi:hypothetical protein